MLYDQDDEENFLSDRKIGEVEQPENAGYTRRGYKPQEIEEEPQIRPEKSLVKVEDDEGAGILGIVVTIIAIIVVVIALYFVVKIFTADDTNSNTNAANTTSSSNTSGEASSGSSSSISNSGISSLSDMYDAYAIKIESVVYLKAGNFYNNTEGIEGDKAYIEYKQISGLKDEEKEEKINEKLKELSVQLYDKNYLSDEDTLFIDVHTKLSVNFNTLSYLVIKTYEDIDGNRVDEKVVSYNIRLSNLEEIEFEDLFTSDTTIKDIYSSYKKGDVYAYYFDPECIYVYDEDLTETKIDMSKYYSNIAIYSLYSSDTNIFESSTTQKKVFSTLSSTVSEETTDRAFTEK